MQLPEQWMCITHQFIQAHYLHNQPGPRVHQGAEILLICPKSEKIIQAVSTQKEGSVYKLDLSYDAH